MKNLVPGTFLLAGLLASFPGTASPTSPARSESLAAKVPGNTAIFLEIHSPKKLVRQFLNSDLWEKIQKIPAIQAGLEDRKLAPARAMLEGFKRSTGMSLEKSLGNLANESLAVAIRPGKNSKKPDAILLLKGRDTSLPRKAVNSIGALVVLMGDRNKLEEGVDGSVSLSIGKELFLAAKDQFLAVSTDDDLLREAGALIMGKSTDSLARRSHYQDMAGHDGEIGGGFIDLAAIRAQLPEKKRERFGKGEPGGAIILGGLMEVAGQAEVCGLSLDREGDALIARLTAPAQAKEMSGMVSPPAEQGSFTPPPGLISRFQFRRDLESFWVDHEKYVEERFEKRFAKFSSDMGVFFGGRQFGTEVLPELGSYFEVFVTRQDYSDLAAPPLIRYPGGALVLVLKNPETFGAQFQMAFQTALGVINADRGQKKLPGLMLDQVDVQGTKILTARYMNPPEEGQPAPNEMNLTPACAVVGNRVILSSSLSLARDLIPRYQAGATTGSGSAENGWVNDRWHLDGAGLQQIVRDNREAIIASNQLTKMQSEEEASLEVDTLLALLGLLRSVSLEQRVTPDLLEYAAKITVN